ncbi:MAG: hypothetical protein U1C55_11875, partial [Smithellaceae bacterium]|nr:hypothetical protein [Smithellaceae bacterium]
MAARSFDPIPTPTLPLKGREVGAVGFPLKGREIGAMAFLFMGEGEGSPKTGILPQKEPDEDRCNFLTGQSRPS